LPEILTAEDMEFLRQLANELRTQDTLGTARPVLFQIRELRREWGIDPDFTENEGVLIGDEPVECTTLADAKTYLVEHEYGTTEQIAALISLEEVQEYCERFDITCTLTGYRDQEVLQNAFLTRSGAEEHLACFGYHYSSGAIYVSHAHRNPQLARLLQIIEKFATPSEDTPTA